jgi:hypothetical protein
MNRFSGAARMASALSGLCGRARKLAAALLMTEFVIFFYLSKN